MQTIPLENLTEAVAPLVIADTLPLTAAQKALVQSVSRMVKGCRFASFNYSPKSAGGGRTRYNLILGASYPSLVSKSIEALNALGALETVSGELFAIAKGEIMASLTETKETGKNKAYTKVNTYLHLGNGVKLNVNDFSFEIDGVVQSKVEIIPGVYKVVNSKPLTIAKNLIRNTLPISKYRSFCLESECMAVAKVNGETFEILAES